MKSISQEDLRVHLEQVPYEHPDLIRWDTARQIEAALHPAAEPSRAELLEASQKAVDTMRLLSPWTALLTAELDSEKEYQKIDLEIFRPSVKDLNGEYLGYQGTNDYVAEIRTIVNDTFTVNGIAPHVLGLPFKGASILALNGMKPEEIEQKVQSIRAKATYLLIKKAIAFAKTKSENANESDDQIKTKLGFNESFYVDIEFGVKPWGKIDQEKLIDSDENAKKFAVNIEDSVRAVYEAIRRSTFDRRWREESLEEEYRQRPDDRRENKGVSDMHRVELNDRHRIYDLLKQGYAEFFHTVATVQSNGRISVKPAWREVARVKKGNLVLNETYIHYYRKGTLQKYLQDKGKAEQYPIIEGYMRTLKILDTLHTYTIDESFPAFLEKVRRITALIKSAENLQNATNEDLKKFLTQASNELKVSLKDEGEGTFATEHAMIDYLMKTNGDIRLDIGDIRGFGDSSLALLSTQVAQIAYFYNPEVADSIEKCEDVLLRSNDLGTKVLNRLKKKAQSKLSKGENLSIFDQGDEFNQLTTNTKNPAENIKEIARASRMRIVSILLTDFQVKTKEDIRTLIALFKWADEETTKLKSAEISYKGPEDQRPPSVTRAKYIATA